MNRDLLFELFVEDLPARFAASGILQLEANARKIFDRMGLTFKELKVYGTPRRLILHVQDLLACQPDRTERRTGPSEKSARDDQGNWTKAAQGFARSAGVDPDDLEWADTEKGKCLLIEKKIPGRATAELLPAVFQDIYNKFHFDRTMVWKDPEISFPRPVRGVLVLWGDDCIDLELGGVRSSREVRGHRSLSIVPVFSADTIRGYFKGLKENGVIYDQNEREKIIREQAEKKASGQVRFDPSLMATVVYLIEFPVVQICRFDEAFFKLPEALTVKEMQEHQKYFPVYDQKGELNGEFAVVLNCPVSDYTGEGNVRVLTARLKDAEFFIQEDLKSGSLDGNLEKLTRVIQHQKLGAMSRKTENINRLAVSLTEALGWLKDKETILRTAFLCKADLVTSAVFEFPELQGVMGGEYAVRLGEEEETGIGIRDHYLPAGADDPLPSNSAGIVTALADKIDSLTAGFFAGLKPTSSKDPYQLKRATFGIIRILVEKELSLNLPALLRTSLEFYTDDPESVLQEILAFLRNRISTVFRSRGIEPDEVEAILSVDFTDLFDAYKRISVLHEFRSREDFSSLLTGLKRMSHILSGQAVSGQVNEALLKEPAEVNLFSLYDSGKAGLEGFLADKDYSAVFTLLASFRPAVDRFFDDVLVMAPEEDLKKNRLILLSSLTGLFRGILDFEKITVKQTA